MIWKTYCDNEVTIVRSNGKYIPMWRNPADGKEWNEFGGSVGYFSPSYDTYKEAKDFIEKGLAEEIKNPEIWLDMVAC